MIKILCSMRSMRSNNIVFALLGVFIAAWMAQTYAYLPVADDFPFAKEFNKGLWKWVLEAYSATGIRRSFVFLFNAPLCAAPLWITNYLLVAAHLVCTLLLFYVCCKLAGSAIIGYFAALLFGVFPFLYGAVTWACGSYIISNTAFFLAGMAILLRYAEGGFLSQWSAITLSSVCLFVACVIGEHVIFAAALVGPLALASTAQGLTFAGMLRPWVLAPGVAVAVYLILVLATQSGVGLTDAAGSEKSLYDSFNPNTLASVWFYQWRYLLYFQPWLNYQAIVLTVAEMGGVRLFVGLALLAVGLRFLRAACREPTQEAAYNVARTGTAVWWRGPIPLIVVMMLAVSFVHALAGGFSAQSRHQYVPLAVLMMLLAAVSREFPAVQRLCRWWKGAFLATLSIVAVFTTWMVCSINRFELRSYTNVNEFFSTYAPKGPVALEYDPPVYWLWPAQSRTLAHSYDAEWVLNLGITVGRNGSPLKLSEDPGKRFRIVRDTTNAKCLVLEQ